MTEHLDLGSLDPSGAVAEAADAVTGDAELEEAAARGDTRAQILRKAAMGGSAVMGGGLLLGGLTGTAMAADTRSAKQDRDILNYALTLEYLEAAFYAEANQKAGLTGDAATFAKTAGAHEAAHVDFLKKALGSAAVASPAFTFGDTTANRTNFLKTAVVLEDTGVAAYIGQAYRLKNTRTILIASHVLAVEARHAAWVRSLIPDAVPAPDAFNGSTFDANGFPRGGYARMSQVLAGVKQLGFIA
jgi:hypothetical protein